jgi:hypothetical protein
MSMEQVYRGQHWHNIGNQGDLSASQWQRITIHSNFD